MGSDEAFTNEMSFMYAKNEMELQDIKKQVKQKYELSTLVVKPVG